MFKYNSTKQKYSIHMKTLDGTKKTSNKPVVEKVALRNFHTLPFVRQRQRNLALTYLNPQTPWHRPSYAMVGFVRYSFMWSRTLIKSRLIPCTYHAVIDLLDYDASTDTTIWTVRATDVHLMAGGITEVDELFDVFRRKPSKLMPTLFPNLGSKRVIHLLNSDTKLEKFAWDNVTLSELGLDGSCELELPTKCQPTWFFKCRADTTQVAIDNAADYPPIPLTEVGLCKLGATTTDNFVNMRVELCPSTNYFLVGRRSAKLFNFKVDVMVLAVTNTKVAQSTPTWLPLDLKGKPKDLGLPSLAAWLRPGLSALLTKLLPTKAKLETDWIELSRQDSCKWAAPAAELIIMVQHDQGGLPEVMLFKCTFQLVIPDKVITLEPVQNPYLV